MRVRRAIGTLTAVATCHGTYPPAKSTVAAHAKRGRRRRFLREQVATEDVHRFSRSVQEEEQQPADVDQERVSMVALQDIVIDTWHALTSPNDYCRSALSNMPLAIASS